MNVLLINSPSRRGKSGLMIPLGLLYVAGIIQRCGHSAKIIDPYLKDDYEESNCISREYIFNAIEEIKPAIVGYGGIATSYGFTKELSREIKAKYPEIYQIAGGALSSVYKLLLANTSIDVVFHGETEVSLPIFLSEFATGAFHETPGISYRKGKDIIKNDPPHQIKDLDKIPVPPYEIINLRSYFHNIDEWLESYKETIGNNPNFDQKRIKVNSFYIPIVTSRGCSHKCLFCYRHFRGHRQHSVNYVIDHMEYLNKEYGLDGFQFVDELFNSNKEWVAEFCEKLERKNLNIYYLIGGARVDKIDENMLRRLKETGCIQINYGQESGSNTILDELRKGVTAQRNKEITKLTNSIGLVCPVQLVIGAPKESFETINETIQFLKDVEARTYSLNYLIPLPETPIWNYVEKKSIIKDVEDYLELLAEIGGSEPLVNLTPRPDNEWRRWSTVIRRKMELFYYQRTKKLPFLYNYLVYSILNIILFFIPKNILKEIIPNRIKQIIKG